MAGKPPLLFVSNSGPLPVTDGKRQRTYALLKALELSFDIDFLMLHNEDEFNLTRQSADFERINFIHYTAAPSGNSRLHHKLGFLFFKDQALFDYVKELRRQRSYQFIFSRYLGPVASMPSLCKIVCDIDDDFFEVYKTKIKSERKWLRKLRLIQIFILNVIPYIRAKNKVTHLIHVKGIPNKDELILPNLPFQVLLNAGPIELVPCLSKNILFVGKLSYQPNADGLYWFLKEVWPGVVQMDPDVRLTIISSEKTTHVGLLNCIAAFKNIADAGKVEVLADHYYRHSLVIAPVFYGGGSNIKVAEALLFGRPVFTTTFGAKGYEQPEQLQFVKVSSEPVTMKEAIVSHLNDTHQDVLQEKIFAWAQSTYSISQWQLLLSKFLIGEMENTGTNHWIFKV